MSVSQLGDAGMHRRQLCSFDLRQSALVLLGPTFLYRPPRYHQSTTAATPVASGWSMRIQQIAKRSLGWSVTSLLGGWWHTLYQTLPCFEPWAGPEHRRERGAARTVDRMAELLMNSAIPSEGSMRTSWPALCNGYLGEAGGYQKGCRIELTQLSSDQWTFVPVMRFRSRCPRILGSGCFR